MIAYLPVKAFGVAKARLAPLLDAKHRSVLGQAVAERTARIVEGAGARAVIVTGDSEVVAWAKGLGIASLHEGPHRGLDRAAHKGLDDARKRSEAWAIVHADLPLITVADVDAITQGLTEHDFVLAPARDGGTNLVAGRSGHFAFSYGPGSFRRHLAIVSGGRHQVVSRIGLALDLDSPADFRAVLALPGGSWVNDLT